MGKPGFPIPPPGGRVWEGAVLPRIMFIPSVCDASRMDAWRRDGERPPGRQGYGETRFPIPPPGGRVWEGAALPGSMFIPSVCDASRMDVWRRDGECLPGGQRYGETRFPSVRQGCRNINQQV